MPQQKQLLVVEEMSHRKESMTNRRGYESTTYYSYWYAGGIKMSENNFPCINFLPGDSIILTRSKIYKLQTQVTALSGYYKGEICEATYNPFGLRGLFTLLPILFAIGAILSKEKGGAIVGAGVALAVYFAAVCSLFIL